MGQEVIIVEFTSTPPNGKTVTTYGSRRLIETWVI